MDFLISRKGTRSESRESPNRSRVGSFGASRAFFIFFVPVFLAIDTVGYVLGGRAIGRFEGSATMLLH